MIAEQAQFAKAANIGLGLDASIGKLLGRLGVGIEGRASGEKVNRETGEVQAKRQQAFDEAFNAISDQEAREAWSLHQQTRSAEQARHGHSIATGERESTTAGAARESQKQGGLRELASTLKSLSTKISQAEGVPSH